VARKWLTLLRWQCIRQLESIDGTLADEIQSTKRMSNVYIDKLTPDGVRGLLLAGITSVTLLEKTSEEQRRHADVLRKHGVAVEESDFFAGHLKDDSGESLLIAARKLAFRVSMEAATSFVARQPVLKRLNAEYGRETLRLSLAKSLWPQTEKVLMRALAAQALSRPTKASVWVEEPAALETSLLSKHLPDIDLTFYRGRKSRLHLILQRLLWSFAKRFRRQFGFRNRIAKVPASKPSVYSLQEDDIHFDHSLRGQPHWIDICDTSPSFRTFIRTSAPYTTGGCTDRELATAKVSLVAGSTAAAAWSRRKSVPALRRLGKARLELLVAAFGEENLVQTGALLQAYELFHEAEQMGSLAVWLNVRVFLVRETSMSLADAMQLVAPCLNIVTIAYQYSNIGYQNLVQTSTADYYVIFSPMYKDVLQIEGISPKHWVIGGYLYDEAIELLRSKAERHRAKLLAKGVEFIVGYFDEMVHHDRWGLVFPADHLREIQALAQMVLNNPGIGVVTKSQFFKNSPSRLYADDETLRHAVATGRFIELEEGCHRNDIYPMEAAMASDLCIGHKFGATAALEAALAGVRCVLLNNHGTKTNWDQLYAKSEIEFESIEAILNAIYDLRACKEATSRIGDWGPILSNFDPLRDGDAGNRLRRLVEECL
jgi:hypothetical protein